MVLNAVSTAGRDVVPALKYNWGWGRGEDNYNVGRIAVTEELQGAEGRCSSSRPPDNLVHDHI